MTDMPVRQAADEEQNTRALVLMCLKRERKEDKIASLGKLTPEDWQAVADVAVRLGAGPLVFHTINPFIARLAVPADFHRKMRELYYNSAARNMRLYRQLAETLSAFNRENIAVILLKGAHLAESVYGNPALRPMADVDILAKRDDLARIDRILRELGYSTSRQSAGCALEHLAPYTKRNAVHIEVHFHITTPPFSERFDPAELWPRARKQKYDGVEVLTLGAEDLLLHLSVHTCADHGCNNGLLPYLDIVHAVEHYENEIDWKELVNRAGKWGVDRCVVLMLGLVEKMLGLSLPDNARQAIKEDAGAMVALAAAEQMIFEKGPYVSPNIARLFEKGWRTKLKYFLSRVFPSQETMMVKNTNANAHINIFELLKLYRARWKGLRQRHSRTIWTALRKNPQALAAIALRAKRNSLSDWLRKTES